MTKFTIVDFFFFCGFEFYFIYINIILRVYPTKHVITIFEKLNWISIIMLYNLIM